MPPIILASLFYATTVSYNANRGVAANLAPNTAIPLKSTHEGNEYDHTGTAFYTA